MADDDQEVEEINEDSIKQLAQQVAGGDSGEDSGGEDGSAAEPEQPSPAEMAESGAGTEMAVERLKSTIDMLKEQNASTSDRMQTLSQSLGEVRQMVHSQESNLSSMEADVDKLKDQFDELEPQEIRKKMDRIRSDIESNEASIQKLREKLDKVEQTANDVQVKLNELGSMDNLIDLNKEFDEKLNEIKEAERYIERLASKSEKINVRINKKMSEYSTYKAKVDSLQEKTSDMFRKVDDLELDVEDAVEEDELEKLRERIQELESQLEEYGKIAPLADMSLPEPIVQLREKRNDIESFLEDLETQHEEGKISTSEYERIKDANEQKLEDIREKLVKAWQGAEDVIEGAAEDDEEGGSATEALGLEGDEGPVEEPEGSEEVEDDAADEGADADDDAGGEPDEYGEILDASVEEVKEEVASKNLDVERLLELEREGQDRATLIDWLESKTGE